MSRTSKLAAFNVFGNVLSCGRTLDEQVETIREHGNHGMVPVLRAGLLAALGVSKPKDTARNCVIFGCYRPFTTPFLVRDSIRLLEVLSIDYTYLQREYCCGVPLTLQTSEDKRDNVMALGGEFNLQNLDLARQKGATKLAYCCAGCAHAARHAFRDTVDSHVYILDLILDGLQKHRLTIPPTIMGYFEGCHVFSSANYPAGRIGWGRYRHLLNDIEGLQIVDLPKNMCCKESSAEIIESAVKMNLDKILLSCSGCYSSITQAAKGMLQVITLQELLLRSLESDGIHSHPDCD
ncbi:MAG: hypothetical protein HQK89_07025 [Nitrospirae bacterium]|nr:hypothetical protein [Nitrospirota bacterium]